MAHWRMIAVRVRATADLVISPKHTQIICVHKARTGEIKAESFLNDVDGEQCGEEMVS
jgi:hypothetical protein